MKISLSSWIKIEMKMRICCSSVPAEPNNDLFNTGIVDMSHKYPQMYVVRPSFFVPIISLLRNASMKSLEVRRELSLMKSKILTLPILKMS